MEKQLIRISFIFSRKIHQLANTIPLLKRLSIIRILSQAEFTPKKETF